MDSIIKLPADQLAILASVVAIALSKGLSNSDQNVLGNFITAVGASLLTVAAQNQALSPDESTPSATNTPSVRSAPSVNNTPSISSSMVR